MKYENFEATKEKCEKIVKIDEKLQKLSEPLVVTIATERDKYSEIYTIGVFGNSEHDYYLAGKVFIDSIVGDLKSRREQLISELEKL